MKTSLFGLGPLTILRFGFTLNNRTPYIVYTTRFGKCCKFVKKTYLHKVLSIYYSLLKPATSTVPNTFKITYMPVAKTYHATVTSYFNDPVIDFIRLPLDRLTNIVADLVAQTTARVPLQI